MNDAGLKQHSKSKYENRYQILAGSLLRFIIFLSCLNCASILIRLSFAVSAHTYFGFPEAIRESIIREMLGSQFMSSIIFALFLPMWLGLYNRHTKKPLNFSPVAFRYFILLIIEWAARGFTLHMHGGMLNYNTNFHGAGVIFSKSLSLLIVHLFIFVILWRPFEWASMKVIRWLNRRSIRIKITLLIVLLIGTFVLMQAGIFMGAAGLLQSTSETGRESLDYNIHAELARRHARMDAAQWYRENVQTAGRKWRRGKRSFFKKYIELKSIQKPEENGSSFKDTPEEFQDVVKLTRRILRQSREIESARTSDRRRPALARRHFRMEYGQSAHDFDFLPPSRLVDGRWLVFKGSGQKDSYELFIRDTERNSSWVLIKPSEKLRVLCSINLEKDSYNDNDSYNDDDNYNDDDSYNDDEDNLQKEERSESKDEDDNVILEVKLEENKIKGSLDSDNISTLFQHYKVARKIFTWPEMIALTEGSAAEMLSSVVKTSEVNNELDYFVNLAGPSMEEFWSEFRYQITETLKNNRNVPGLVDCSFKLNAITVICLADPVVSDRVYLSIVPSQALFTLLTALPGIGLGISLGVGLIAAVIGLILANSLVVPIVRLAGKTRMVASGNMNVPIEVTSQDEIGTLENSFRDMMERIKDKMRLVNQELLEEKDRLSILIDNSAEGIVLLNEERRIMMINPQAARLIEADPENALGYLWDEVRVGNPAARSEDLHYTETVNRSSEISSNRSLISFSVQGQQPYRYVLETFSSVTEGYEGGGAIVILRDVTMEKDVDRMKSEFVSSVSHELRTPLTSIMAFTEMILDGEAEDEELRKEYLNIIHDESERLTRLVNDVLDLSRIESGRLKPKISEFDLVDVVRRTIEVTSPAGDKKEIVVKLEENTVNSIIMSGDRELIGQAVMNLISNGIKYNNRGGYVRLTVSGTPEKAEIIVEDDGFGIPKTELPLLFRKFYRVEKNKREEITGSGLGLVLVREIARLHKGDCEVESEEGRGSLFRLCIATTTEEDLS